MTGMNRDEANERQFRAMIEWMPQLAWWAKPDGFIDYYNPRWYEYTGTTPADMEGWGWQSVHDPALLPSVMERWQHSIATGEPFEMEFPLRGRDGNYRWFLTRVSPMRDEAGGVVRWIGMNTDIDDQKKANDLLSSTLESMSDAFFLLDPSYRMVLVNRNQERVSQTTRAETIGRSLWEVFPATAVPASKYWMEYHRVMEQRTPAHFEEYYAPLDVWTEVDAFPSRDGCIAVFFRDISERKRDELRRAQLLEREREARAEAEAANRAKDEFLAIASHELRTPLQTLKLSTQTFLRSNEYAEDEKLRSRLVKMDRQADRLVELVDSLLDVTKLGSGSLVLDLDEVELVELVRSSFARHEQESREAGVEVILEAPSPVVGRWDRQRLEQVMGNLIGNAIKYGEGRPVHVSVTRTGEFACVVVRDEGIGIAAEHHERIFKRFERAVPVTNYGGFGVGLWIVSRWVEAHRGTVKVVSTPGAGSTFTVELPLR